MRWHSRSAVVLGFAALTTSLLPLGGASAVELIKNLDCALIQTTQKGADYCLKVVNTCNTPIVSRIEERGGAQKDSAQVPRGERTTLCSSAPFTFLGSYIAGPLATGAGD